MQFDPELNVGAECKDEINKFTNEELRNYFRNSDEISVSNGSNVFTYYTEDSLGVSIDVPHVLGDTNSEVWNDFEATLSQ